MGKEILSVLTAIRDHYEKSKKAYEKARIMETMFGEKTKPPIADPNYD
jgi:hypothetical protein